MCIADHIVGDAAIAGGQGHRLAAERLGEPQRVGDAVALLLGELQAASALDIENHEGTMQPVGEPLGIAHQPGAARILADADGDALAGRPRTLDGMRLHFREQLLIDPLRGAAQRQFAQRRQIGRREEMLERALGLFGHVDLALLQALNEVVGSEVNDLDGVGAVEHGVGDSFAYADMGDLRDDVVEALDVLDVDRGVDVDAAAHQLFDIEIAFGVAAAVGIGMGEFVDQDDLRPACNHRVDVHLFEKLALIFDLLARNDFEAVHQRLGFAAAVGLDHADHDVIAVLLESMRLLQHFVGLADARSGADENAKLADPPFFAPRLLKQRLRRRPGMFGVAPLISHHEPGVFELGFGGFLLAQNVPKNEDRSEGTRSGPVWGTGLLAGGQFIERQIEFENVDARLAQKPEPTAFGMLGDQRPHAVFRQSCGPWRRAAPGTGRLPARYRDRVRWRRW